MFLGLVRASALLPYSETRFGAIWTLLRPFIFLVVMVFIKNQSSSQMGEGVEYSLFLYAGLVLWWYLVDAIKSSSRSPFAYKGLITKIFYPRIITPAIPVVGRLLDLAIQASGVLFMMLLFWQFPGKNFWLLPIAIFNVFLLALGLGYLAAVATVAYRDTERILDYLLYIGLFISPVIYSPSLVPEDFRVLYGWLNPTVGPLSTFRAALYADSQLDVQSLVSSLIVSIILFIVGAVVFQRAQTRFAENL
jgi:lipopolysaccharide transport system permease protein